MRWDIAIGVGFGVVGLLWLWRRQGGLPLGMQFGPPTPYTRGAHFSSTWRRSAAPAVIVWHENAGRSASKTWTYLEHNGLSVDFVIDRDGSITRHIDADRYGAHAGSAVNSQSVGIEIINPYYPDRDDAGAEVIDVAWAHKGRYTVPPLVQMEAAWTLAKHLHAAHGIPLRASGAVRSTSSGQTVFRWGRAFDASRNADPGMHAHHEWHHADGLFVLHYCECRSLGYTPAVAYDLTRTRAQEAHGWTSGRDTIMEGPALV